MRGSNNQKLGDIVKKLMKNPKISHRLEKLNVLDVWQDIIGVQLCKYITDQKIHKDILYVKIKSPVVRNELSYKKSDFIKQINKRIGKNIINDIVLR